MFIGKKNQAKADKSLVPARHNLGHSSPAMETHAQNIAYDGD
jgi:hypothetical protein